MEQFLPYGRQTIDDADIAAVVDVLRGDWLTTGPTVDAFEAALAASLNASNALAVSNGTAALHLALAAVGLKPGDTAIVPSITFVATANAVRLCGGEIVFSDVDPVSGLMTPETLLDAIERAKAPVAAILPVHLGGRMVEMRAVARIARDHGAAVIEDACHAIGGLDNDGNAIGACAHSDAATFSFHPVKTIASGEGGAVSCRDPLVAEKIRALRSHGLTRDPSIWCDERMKETEVGPAPWYYEMPDIGLNYRLPDILCALANSQLTKLDRFVTRRQALAARYTALLEENPIAGVTPTPTTQNPNGAWHLYQVAMDFDAIKKSRARVMTALRDLNIGTQVHYVPVHGQPYYQRRYGRHSLPGATRFYERTLSLPLFPAMQDDDPERVVDALRSIVSS